VSSRAVIRTWVVSGVAALGFLLAALAVAGYFRAAFGVQAALLGLLVAIIPLTIVIPTFIWLDRFEAEPTRYLVGGFLWGALVAALVAATVNTSAMAVIEAVATRTEATLVTAVVVAPVVEEAAKGAFVLLIWWFARREFDGLIDGMVYAGLVAAGFAFTENIQYLAQAWTDGGQDLLTATFIGRGLMSPFAHPMFTVLTGIGIGIAAHSRSAPIRWTAPVVGYLCAVLSHALWNLAATTSGQGMLAVYLIVELPIFLAWVALIVWARRREGRLIGTFLRPYADAGWLSPAEVAMLSTMARRREARAWARANAGRPGLTSMRAFQDAASDLALLRRRMLVTGHDVQSPLEERRLLTAIVENRRRFIGASIV
jgi:RsiW-degrading membrane proteinase PrsW (M82 family)